MNIYIYTYMYIYICIYIYNIHWERSQSIDFNAAERHPGDLSGPTAGTRRAQRWNHPHHGGAAEARHNGNFSRADTSETSWEFFGIFLLVVSSSGIKNGTWHILTESTSFVDSSAFLWETALDLEPRVPTHRRWCWKASGRCTFLSWVFESHWCFYGVILILSNMLGL